MSAPGLTGSNNTPVEVNFGIDVDANGEIVILGASALSVQNVIVAATALPVAALYTATDSMFEFYEPSNDLGVISGELSSITGDYKNLTRSLENGLYACIKGPMDAKYIPDSTAPTVFTIAAPFNDTKYAANAEQYRKASSFGDLALAAIAHHIMGHVAATSAITNDQAFVNGMNSSTFVPYEGEALTTPDAYSATLTPSKTDAMLAKALVKAIAGKLPADATTIARQVIGKDASRAMDQDNNKLPVDVRHRLKFIAGDVIYMNIKLQQPSVVISTGQKVAEATLEGKFPAVSATTTNYTLKITLV